MERGDKGGTPCHWNRGTKEQSNTTVSLEGGTKERRVVGSWKGEQRRNTVSLEGGTKEHVSLEVGTKEERLVIERGDKGTPCHRKGGPWNDEVWYRTVIYRAARTSSVTAIYSNSIIVAHDERSSCIVAAALYSTTERQIQDDSRQCHIYIHLPSYPTQDGRLGTRYVGFTT